MKPEWSDRSAGQPIPAIHPSQTTRELGNSLSFIVSVYRQRRERALPSRRERFQAIDPQLERLGLWSIPTRHDVALRRQQAGPYPCLQQPATGLHIGLRKGGASMGQAIVTTCPAVTGIPRRREWALPLPPTRPHAVSRRTLASARLPTRRDRRARRPQPGAPARSAGDGRGPAPLPALCDRPHPPPVAAT